MRDTTIRRARRPRQIAVFLLVVAAALAIGGLFYLRTPEGKHDVAPTPSAALPAESTPVFPEYVAPPRSEVSDDEAAVARALNAATPAIPTALARARPFVLDRRSSPDDRLRARDCLAAAVHYEAASEGAIGQRAVAQVVLNRVRHPAFPNSVCDVVFQGSTRVTGCQFTFTCDGSLRRVPNPIAWQRALRIADDALAGWVETTVGTATHYHANWVAPYWRTSLTKLATIGAHIFYRWQGGWGERRAFSNAYRGGESDFSALLALATTTDAAVPDPLATDPLLPAVRADTGTASPLPSPPPVAADRVKSSLSADDQPGTLKADETIRELRR
jgi:spore germination cell wall hydrolase CwlJ-like protein